MSEPRREFSDGRAREACALLWRLWRAGEAIDAIPDDLRPATRAQGYAIQAHFEALSAEPLFGWKIAATSKAGQAHINVDGPLAGRLLAERVVPLGTPVRLGANRMLVAEVEFAFRMGRDLAPRAALHTLEETMNAVAELHLAIEVPDSRFENFLVAGAPQLIADNACACQFILGPKAGENWRGLDLAGHRVAAALNGRPAGEGSGANVLGDPRVALSWLANELSSHGLTLRAGEVVTTGTCVTPLKIAPGDSILGDFGALGRVEAHFLA